MEHQELASLSLESLLQDGGIDCSCHRHHTSPVKQVELGQDILWKITSMAGSRNMRHPVVVADRNTCSTGKEVCRLLEEAGIQPEIYVMKTDKPEPDEYWVGALLMQYVKEWDGIVAVGAGTINDICKIAANLTGLPYLLVGTAPSMDGYASNTSSMMQCGLKISLPSTCPEGILLDTGILAKAPMKMLQAGLGDMAAKYISICEWRISNCVTGEYYCEEIAELVRKSLRACMQSSSGLAQRDEEAVSHVAYGLVLSGIAMSFAGVSRPASGTEHYFSHIWEMTALEQHLEHELHGIQVGVGTMLTIPVLRAIQQMEPNRKKALDYVSRFDITQWEQSVRCRFGSSAESIIGREKLEKKFDKEKHRVRLETIIAKWDEIRNIIEEELPEEAWLRDRLLQTGAPVSPDELGISLQQVKSSFLSTKDIRDKYISTRLLWDLGMLEETAGRFWHD